MNKRFAEIVTVLGAALALLGLPEITAAQGMGMSGGGGMGGDGGGGSATRLCAVFNDPDYTVNNIDEDGSGPYCDGTDGEILVADGGIKLSTGTRNPADRTVAVNFVGSTCDIPPDTESPLGDWAFSARPMDTFFAHAVSREYTAPAGCTPGDPFDASFEPDSLGCLERTADQLTAREMRVADGTRFTSMRVNLTDPELGLKKDSQPMVLTFAEGFGPDGQCTIGESALPVAIACTSEENETCNAWHIKTFRACAFDYDTRKGGSWRFAGDACPVDIDVSYTVMP